jgi:hypothetical protein
MVDRPSTTHHTGRYRQIASLCLSRFGKIADAKLLLQRKSSDAHPCILHMYPYGQGHMNALILIVKEDITMYFTQLDKEQIHPASVTRK